MALLFELLQMSVRLMPLTGVFEVFVSINTQGVAGDPKNRTQFGGHLVKVIWSFSIREHGFLLTI